jgi:diaminohydroxyphosphoribosylaminopyrimidine deaminase/5-amino-6-(5-phosphoribosylamino)uracil reductase
MKQRMSESEAMLLAMELALRGWGRVAPNPLVGAVLLRDGSVVGSGFHREYGAPHAEIEAISACDDPHGTTCVLNLEPCSHRGKTPPCTDALVMVGVRRVVFAVTDPNPRAAGGSRQLRAHGIEVESGLLSHEAAALNASFLWSQTRPDRPFVALKLATSMDGFLADAGGSSQWITDEVARAHAHWLRAGFDAIAVGRRTADRDDPQLTARGSVSPRIPPTRVVFSRSGRLRQGSKLLQTADAVPTVLLADSAGKQRAAESVAGSSARVVVAESLDSALATLRRMGINSLLVEGGADLAGQLIAADVVDRLYWYQAPILLGRGLAAFPQQTATELAAAHRWVPTERKALGESNLLVVDRELCLPV